MIIVLGSVLIQPAKFEQALQISQAHVARSRLEAGCIEHGVHLDADNPNRLVFVERWASQAALQAHFAVPASRHTVRALAALAAAPPSISLFTAEPLPFPGPPAA